MCSSWRASSRPRSGDIPIFGRITSFRTRLLLLVAVSSAIASLLVGSVLMYRSYTRLRNAAIDGVTTQARVIAENSASTLNFDDPRSARETLAALRLVPGITYAGLYRDGVVFAEQTFRSPRGLPALAPGAPGHRFDEGWLVVNEPVLDVDKTAIGALLVVYDMNLVTQQLRASVLISGLIGLAAAFGSVLIAVRLQRLLARPVDALSRTARRISSTGEYGARAEKYGDDELGQLTDVFNDMLDQIQRQTAEIEAAHQQFRLAVESAPNAIVMVDHAGCIVMVNAETERLFGYSREELTGRPVELLIPERFRGSHPGYRGGFIADPKARQMGIGRDLFGRHKDGSEIPIEVGLAPIEGEGGARVLSAIVDISERKRAEQERQQLLESERAARGEAERASHVKDEFLATLSHELRTPMTAILGWAQMLRRKPDGTGLDQGLEIIERNARVQTQIIEDLLDMSRILSGKIRLDVQQVDLAEVVEAAIATVQPAAEARGIRIQKVLDPHPGPVRGDPNRLQQIAWNLLSNAIKFTDKGGRVQVVLERVNSHVEISISDTGRGISPEFLPQLFQRFSQADSSASRRHGGLGIGLAIVKQLVELHGGSIAAASPGEGHGSTFTVKLPLSLVRQSDPPEERAHPRTPRDGAGVDQTLSLHGLRVLVVEDEPDARELIARILEDYRATVIRAGSAAEAMQAFEIQPPNLLVSDIGMPQIDGYELIRMIRTMPPGAGGTVPAIALTAFARSEDRTRALLAGYQAHVAKPVEPPELIATVASITGRTALANLAASELDEADPRPSTK